MNRLEGLRAVVIGVGSGIGRACAVAFAREEAEQVLAVVSGAMAAHGGFEAGEVRGP